MSSITFSLPIFHENNHRKPDDGSDCHDKDDHDDVHGGDGGGRGDGGDGGDDGGVGDDDDGVQGELLSSLVVLAPPCRGVLQSSQEARTEPEPPERPTPV